MVLEEPESTILNQLTTRYHCANPPLQIQTNLCPVSTTFQPNFASYFLIFLDYCSRDCGTSQLLTSLKPMLTGFISTSPHAPMYQLPNKLPRRPLRQRPNIPAGQHNLAR